MWDLRGAAAVGMNTIYVPRPSEAAESHPVKSKADGGEVDLVVASFTELASVLSKQG